MFTCIGRIIEFCLCASLSINILDIRHIFYFNNMWFKFILMVSVSILEIHRLINSITLYI